MEDTVKLKKGQIDTDSFVLTDEDQEIDGNKLFLNPIKIPNGVAVNDAISVGQLNSAISAANRSVLNDSYTAVKTTAELEADYPSVPLPYYVIAKNTTGNPIIYIKHSVNVWMFQPLGFTS